MPNAIARMARRRHSAHINKKSSHGSRAQGRCDASTSFSSARRCGRARKLFRSPARRNVRGTPTENPSSYRRTLAVFTDTPLFWPPRARADMGSTLTLVGRKHTRSHATGRCAASALPVMPGGVQLGPTPSRVGDNGEKTSCSRLLPPGRACACCAPLRPGCRAGGRDWREHFHACCVTPSSIP